MRRFVTTYMVTLTEPLSDFLRSYIVLNDMEIVYEPKLNTGLVFIRTGIPYHDIIKMPYFTKVTKEAQRQLHQVQTNDRLRRVEDTLFVGATRPIENLRINERFGVGVLAGNGIATIRNIGMHVGVDWDRPPARIETWVTDPPERLVIPAGAPGPEHDWR